MEPNDDILLARLEVAEAAAAAEAEIAAVDEDKGGKITLVV
jgi:hypothetical protein